MTGLAIEDASAAVEPTVRGYLRRRLTSDDHTADDLTQEVFLCMCRHMDDLRSAERVGPWASRIARSILIDHVRRVRTAVPLPYDARSTPAPDDEPFDARGLAAYAQAQVGSLPAHEAEAIRLVDLQCVPPAQAACQLGIGLPALKARLRRGRQHLREAIDRCCAVLLDAQGRPTACDPRSPLPTCSSCS